MDLIKQLEAEEIKRLAKVVPEFSSGDTVVVNVNVVEGERKRLQAYEGIVIAKRNRGLNSSFIVRKISSGEGVERTFQTYSPLIASIEVKRRGDVGRAKLYYLRQRTGKAARIREKLTGGEEAQRRDRGGAGIACAATEQDRRAALPPFCVVAKSNRQDSEPLDKSSSRRRGSIFTMIYMGSASAGMTMVLRRASSCPYAVPEAF